MGKFSKKLFGLYFHLLNSRWRAVPNVSCKLRLCNVNPWLRGPLSFGDESKQLAKWEVGEDSAKPSMIQLTTCSNFWNSLGMFWLEKSVLILLYVLTVMKIENKADCQYPWTKCQWKSHIHVSFKNIKSLSLKQNILMAKPKGRFHGWIMNNRIAHKMLHTACYNNLRWSYLLVFSWLGRSAYLKNTRHKIGELVCLVLWPESVPSE